MRKNAFVLLAIIMMLAVGCRNTYIIPIPSDIYPGGGQDVNEVGQDLGFEGGNGDADTPFIIADVNQIENLLAHVAEGNDFSGKTFSLQPGVYHLYVFSGTTASISTLTDGTTSDWMGIGTKDTPFRGTFIGNDSVITGLNMYGSDTAEENAHGFFNYVGDGASISGLTIEGDIAYDGTESVVGLLVGMVSSGTVTISDCHTSDTSTVKGGTAGGLVGKTDADTTLLISGSSNKADIQSTGNEGDKIAGIVAYIKGEAEISDTQNNGDIDAIRYSGGIAGNAWNTVFTNVTNTGTVSGSRAIGGIVGNTRGTSSITGAVNDGTIEITEDSVETENQHGIGGVVGLAQGDSLFIEDSENKAEIGLASLYPDEAGRYIAQVGGIVGSVPNKKITILGCTNSGAIEVNPTNARSEYVGGIAGYIEYSITNGDVLIGTSDSGKRTVNEGTVSGQSLTAGIVSEYHGGKITADNKNDITGSMYVGGIVGKIDDDAGRSYVIAESHNSGNVNGTQFVGGIVGYGKALSDSAIEISSATSAADKEIISKGIYAGGVVGYGKALSDSAIEISSATSAADKEIIPEGKYAGGIVGFGSDNITITGAENHSSVTGALYVGGIAGGINAQLADIDNPGISDSKNTGTIESVVNADNKDSGNSVGGIVGYLYYGASIKGSANTGTIIGVEGVGGIAGRTLDAAEISGCTNDCTIEIAAYDDNSSKTRWGGGIVGLVTGRDNTVTTLIKDCKSSLTVTSNSPILAQIGGTVGTVGNRAKFVGGTSSLTIDKAFQGTVGDSVSGFIGLIYDDNTAGTIAHDVSFNGCEVTAVPNNVEHSFIGNKSGFEGVTFLNCKAPAETESGIDA